MGKNNEILSPDEAAKNINDLTSIVFDFLNERKIGYADGIAIMGSVLMAAFQYVCIQLEVSAEKTKEAFNAMLDEMKAQQDKHLNDFFEEGDNETTYAN